MIRCSRCSSSLEEEDLNDGCCPFCFPVEIKLVREMTEDEVEVIIFAGCPQCNVPWVKKMGVYYCKECGIIPPTHVRKDNTYFHG